jgi:carboxyl-terminal processing protease
MQIRRSTLAPLVVGSMALLTGGWFLQRGVSQDQNVYAQERLFKEVVNHVADRFVDRKEPSDLYKMAINGLLEELGDPHTAFMTPDDYGQLKVQTQGEYGGLGIQIGKRDGWITVISPLPGTPAERAGIQAGDQIIEFNDSSTKDWEEDKAVNTLRGPKGTEVRLKVARIGSDQPIPFKLTREVIHVRSVPAAYMLDNGIGFVELTVFSETSTDELRQAIKTLKSQGMKGLILDLRSNPGGLLDQGVSVSDLFLDRGQLVVETRSRVAGQNQKAFAVDPDEFPNLPVAVLVGPGSASAAEILAGALQDHDRALVLGRTTYGKGSVQQVFQLSSDNYLKMTTARWFTPSGRSIQRPYGIDAHPVESDSANPAAKQDSAKKHIYKTDSGRTVYGGGGIRPDLVVMDSLTTNERSLVEALQKNWLKYLDARFRYGVRYSRDHPDIKPGFPVTPEMVNAFYATLTEAGVTVDRGLYDRGSNWIATWLAYEISYSKFGTQEARKRVNAESAEVQVAADLLRKANNPKALFVQSEAYNAKHPTVAEKKPGSSQER